MLALVCPNGSCWRNQVLPCQPMQLAPRNSLASLLLLSYLLFSAPGCSWSLVSGPSGTSTGRVDQTSDCTSSRVWPIVDTAFATMAGLMGGAYLGGAAAGGAEGDTFWILPYGLMNVAAATVYGFSAWAGYQKTAQCRRWLDTKQRIAIFGNTA